MEDEHPPQGGRLFSLASLASFLLQEQIALLVWRLHSVARRSRRPERRGRREVVRRAGWEEREGRREGRREVEMSAAQERVRVRGRSVSVLEWYWAGCWTLPRKEQERWWTRRQ